MVQRACKGNRGAIRHAFSQRARSLETRPQQAATQTFKQPIHQARANRPTRCQRVGTSTAAPKLGLSDNPSCSRRVAVAFRARPACCRRR